MASIRISKDGGIEIEGVDIDNIGTLVVNPTGPVNTGSGTTTHTSETHDPEFDQDGYTYIAGDNHGGISRRF